MLTARQLDADKFAAKDNKVTEPIRLLPGMRALMAWIPQAPIATRIEVSSEQIMLGGRPLQNLGADLHADAKSWTLDRLDFRPPAVTHVAFSGTNARACPSGGSATALDIDSTHP